MPDTVPTARPGLVVAGQAARRGLRSGLLMGLLFAVSIAATATGFTASFPTLADREKLARSFSTNTGISALIGPARHLDTVAGFTAWRTSGVLTIIGAIWGLLLATKVLRGEEDSGRWELLLAGRTSRRSAAQQAMGGLAVAWVALLVVSGVAAVGIGHGGDIGFSPGASLYLALCLSVSALVFLAVGAVVSQLAPTRQRANQLGGLLLGGAYLVRMAADSTPDLAWLRWASPLGWVEQLHPLTGTHPAALALVVVFVAVGCAGSVALADRRDLGAGSLPANDRPRPRTGLLGSAGGLSVRLARSATVGWVVGLAISGLVFGLVAQSAAQGTQGNTAIADAIGRLGGSSGGAAAYLGLTFLIAAVLVATAAAGQVTAARDEETGGRLDHLLVLPVSRSRWLGVRVAWAVVLVVVASALTGAAAWVGAASQSTGIGFSRLLLSGLNVAPPAVLVLGIGVLAYGLVPRWAPTVAYAVLGWGFLVQLLGSVITTNHLLLDTSVLHHVTPAPAADPNWASAGALVGLGLLAAIIGIVAFSRRDVVGA